LSSGTIRLMKILTAMLSSFEVGLHFGLNEIVVLNN